MASGRAHINASCIAAIPTGIVFGLGLNSILYGIGTFVGCLLGIMLTPDLDQISISKSEWGLVKRFGPLGFLWCSYWWLYAWIIPHRSFWSHFPVVGTVIRLVYITIVPTMFYIYGNYHIDIPYLVLKIALGIVIGLIVSDTLHWIMDII